MACSASAFRGVEDDVVEELGVEPGFEDMCGDAEDRVVEPGAEGDVGDLGVEPGLEDICGDADERVVKPGDGVGDLGVEPGLEDLCDDAEDRVVKPGAEDDAGDLRVEPGLEDVCGPSTSSVPANKCESTMAVATVRANVEVEAKSVPSEISASPESSHTVASATLPAARGQSTTRLPPLALAARQVAPADDGEPREVRGRDVVEVAPASDEDAQGDSRSNPRKSSTTRLMSGVVR